MASFGGFEIEDDIQETPSANTFGGFEIEDEEPSATKNSWLSGDGGSATMPDGELNEWGGNLRNEGRKVLLRRDANGKVNGYSTTSSMLVKDEDGSFAVIPTVVDGDELTSDEAVAHYAKTGEHWGRAQDEKSAREMAQSVHKKHAELNQSAWNDYLHDNWDEVSDEIRNDKGMAYEHKKRTGEKTTLLERMANNDFDEELSKKAEKNSTVTVAGSGIGMPSYNIKREYDETAKMNDLAEVAKDAGLDDWQVKRIRSEAKSPEEMREALAYVAGNRVRGSAPVTSPEDKTGGVWNNVLAPVRGVAHAAADRIPGIIRTAGTLIGGKRDASAPVMEDDPMAKKEGESFDKWYKRVGINPMEKRKDESPADFARRIEADPEIRKGAERYFKWEAPIAGKEGQRLSGSVMARPNTKSWSDKSLGDKMVAIADQVQADIDKIVPRHMGGNMVANFIEDTIGGVGGFAYGGPMMIAESYGNTYQNQLALAKENGIDAKKAQTIAREAASFDAFITAAFYANPYRTWLKKNDFSPIISLRSASYSDMKSAVGNYFAGKTLISQSLAAAEAGALMGVQGAADKMFELQAMGKEADIGEIAVEGVKGAANGAAIALVMGGAHIYAARRNGRNFYDTVIRRYMDTPEGVRIIARHNPEGTAEFCEVFEKGGMATGKQADKAGIPPMDAASRLDYYRKLKALGITSESIRKNAKVEGPEAADGTSAPAGEPPETPPPSAQAAERVAETGETPARFTIPTTADGKPNFAVLTIRDKATGKTTPIRIAVDPSTNIAIMDNGDGTFTTYGVEGIPPVDADSLEKAIDNANTLARGEQIQAAEDGARPLADGESAPFADGAKFEDETEEDVDGNPVVTRVARDKAHDVTILDNNGDGTFTVFGRGIPYTKANSIEDAIAIARGEKPNETGTGSDEAPAQPEQGEVVAPAEPEATEPVEGAEAPSEAADAGVVEPPVSTSEKTSPVATEKPAETAEPVKDAPETDASSTTPAQPAEKPPVAAPKPAEAQSPAEPAKSVETPSRASDATPAEQTPAPVAEPDEGSLPSLLAPEQSRTETPKEGTYFSLPDDETVKVKVDAVDDTHVWYTYVGGALDGGKNEMTIPAWNRLLGNGGLVETKPPQSEAPTPAPADNSASELAPKSPAPEAPMSAAAARGVKKQLDRKLRKFGALSDADKALLKRAEDAIAADKKAKREAYAAKTAERREAVKTPDFLANKKLGDPKTRVKEMMDYLSDPGHKNNSPSMTKAIDLVRGWLDKNGGKLGVLTNEQKSQLRKAVADATVRRDKMLENAQSSRLADSAAELPSSALSRYLDDYSRQFSLLGYWLDHGRALFAQPPAASTAKRGIGFTNTFIDEKYNGKTFDPNAEGAEAFNLFFDGMSQNEREKWKRIIFGDASNKNRKPRTGGVDNIVSEISQWLRGNITGEETGAEDAYTPANLYDLLQAFREEYEEAVEAIQDYETPEDRRAREMAEDEAAAIDNSFGPIDEEIRLAELAAREEADKEYESALAYAENAATGRDVAILKPSALAKAGEGEEIRIDHHKKTFGFLGYDAENGILYLEDRKEVETDEGPAYVPETKYYRVTEDAISEITEEQANGFRNKAGTADDRAADEEGAGAGGSREEVRVEAGEVKAGNPTPETSARSRQINPKAKQYNAIHNALDPKWQAEHPDEYNKLLSEGMDASAVASNPALGETDKVSWPITATRINDREDAVNIFRLLSDPGKESTKVLYLDKDGNILDRRVVAIGSVGTTTPNIKAVVSNVPENTYGIIFSHNHPAQQGESVRPTPDDIIITRHKLKPAVEKAGIQLLDHIITDHNAYVSLGTGDASLASDGAAEFWENAVERYAFEGLAAEKPEDTMNLVPFGERIDLKKDVRGMLDSLAALASKAHDKSSWIVGIDGQGMVPFVASLPKGGDIAAFLAAHPGAQRFAVLNGENAVDMPAFVKAIESDWSDRTDERSRPIVVAIGENGKLADFAEEGLNDKILNAAKPAAPASGTVRGDTSPRPAPRLANVPQLNDAASKAIDDILGKMGGILGENDGVLHADVAPLSLSREEERKFRDAVERMVETLADNGFNTFDDLARVVASRRPDIYGRAKDLLRRSWNFLARDPADEITIARGREIFDTIDTELQPKETTNDTARNGQPGDGSGEIIRDRTPELPAVADRTRVGDAGQETVLGRGRQGLHENNGDGRGRDVRNDEVDGGGNGTGGSAGNGGNAGGERTGVVSVPGEDGEVQRDSEGSVRELNEVSPGFSEYEPPADLPVKAPKSDILIVEPTALASVQSPKIETKPAIPDSIPAKGVLQAHQYHAVCQAVNAHNKLLPDGSRQGYFCGDGTGTGKTRIIAGVLLDAVNRKLGKGKALIISKNAELFESALNDFAPFGLAGDLFELDPAGRKRIVSGKDGIAFTTYPSLAENYAGINEDGTVRSAGKKGGKTCRFAEIVKWLGKDFDGVIAFDEAHSASKDDGSGETASGQAKRAQAVIDLQNALPNARVLYLTATSAYDAADLRFLQRMKLWGEGAAFEDLDAFASAVNKAGLTMMELVTQSLKKRGLYCSRSISFKGVTCRREVAAVTPEQKRAYVDYRDVLAQVHGKLAELAQATGDPVQQLAKQFFARSLDLFNSLITSMKIQKAIELGRQAIADGKSPVFQLIMTNDAAKKAKAESRPPKRTFDLFNLPGDKTGEDAEQDGDIEVGIKDRLIAYLNGNGFPVRQWTPETDSKGKRIRGAVVPEAVALRNSMLELANALPAIGNPIDELVKAFQDVGISRITSKTDKNAEAEAFNSGRNLALVFSGAGGTGASYHADRRFKNQRQRVQIPIEFGWEPDKFIQALGRSHRNNQVVPPEFVLLTTDIAGEMRFMSTIANRVASMGAIVGGDRNSSGQVVSSNDSMDNTYGRDAVKKTLRKLLNGQIPLDLDGESPIRTMYLPADTQKLEEVGPAKFLGRMQFLPVDAQNAVYSELSGTMARAIEQAKANGTYDDGIRKINAKRIVVKESATLATGDAPVDLLTVGEWYDSPRIDHEELEARAPQGRTVEYVRNKKSGRLYGMFQNGDRLVRLAPDGSYTTLLPLERAHYDKVAAESARAEWDAEYAKIPAETEETRTYLSGDLPFAWDKINLVGTPRVYRAQPQDAAPFVGLYIGEAQTPATMYGFGKKEEARKFFASHAYSIVRNGSEFSVGAEAPLDSLPYFKRAKIGTRQVLAAFHVPENSALAEDFSAGGWNKTWAKDDGNAFDRGGDVYYLDFGENAQAALGEIVKKHGAAVVADGRVLFESRDGLVSGLPRANAAGAEPARDRRSRREEPQGRYRPDLVQTGAVRGNLRERVGMPNMRMRVQNGELIITNTDSRRKDDLKLAFGGEWANRVRDGKRYVKSDLRWNRTPNGGWWSISLNKVPDAIRAEIEGEGLLRAPVAPLTSVEELKAYGGVDLLAQNPEEFRATFVYNLLRANIEPLEDPKNKFLSEKELLRRAINDGDSTALGELYKRYMGPNAAKGGLRGLIRRAVHRKGMDGVINESDIEEIASLVWAGTHVDGGYENNRRGIIADLNDAKELEKYKNYESLIPLMTKKVDRILNDMAERAKERPEVQTLDAPSLSREGENVVDSIVAGATEDLNIPVADPSADNAANIIAQKLESIDKFEEGRRLTPAERARQDAMDTLEEMVYYLPEEYQDVFNAILAAERERGFTDADSTVDAEGRKVAKDSLEKARNALGLSKRVFNARLREMLDLSKEIKANKVRGNIDANILIKAREFEGVEETPEDLNESILDEMSDGEATSDMALAVRLLLRGESVQDVADFFEISPAMVRAWKSRARNEHLIEFPGDEENTLGLENMPERKAVPRGKRAPKSSAPKSSAFTPDLFAFAEATVDDTQSDRISEGIAAGASDEQIAREVDVAPEIVKLQRIRETPVREAPIDAAKVRRGEQPLFAQPAPQTSKAQKPAAPADYFADIRGKPKPGYLFAPVEPLEQGTLGIETPVEEIFGYTNAAMDEWRSSRGFAELAKGAKIPLDALYRQGAAMANNTDEMQKMIARHERAPYAMNAADQIALGTFIVKLESEWERLRALKAEQHANGNTAMAVETDLKMDEVFSWIDRAHRVNKRIGSEWGRAGRARQLALDKTGSLVEYMVSCAESKGSPLTKSEKAEAELLYKTFVEAQKKYENLTMDDIIAQLDALSKIRLARQQDGIKQRKGRYTPEQIERDYTEALAQIRYHGEHRSGGTLHGLPNGQKWIRAIEAYHLMNGEGLTDGKPDGAKMAQLVLDDILAQGVDATLWDVRQMESRMGNLIKPSQEEIAKSLRDLHSQMLVEQQIEHILVKGEMPPKTGFDRDEESAAVRGLRRIRDRAIRDRGINRRSYDDLLKSALDAYKRRLQNEIEDLEKALDDIKSGRGYDPREKTKLQLDEEAKARKERRDALKKELEELTRDPAKEIEKRVQRNLVTLARRIAIRKEQIAAIKQQGKAFDFDALKPQKLEDGRLTPMREDLDRLNKEFGALKKALYPDGTDVEIARKLDQRLAARRKQKERWEKMAADYGAADTWEARWAAVAPGVKRPSPENDATRNAAKERDAARRKVYEYRQQLKNEQDRFYPIKAWARFIGGVSVLGRAMLDMTVVGIQGGKYLRSHPIKATKTAFKATKAFFKQTASDALVAEIKNHPYFEDFKKNGGHIYKMDGLEGEVAEDFRVVEQGVRLPNGKVVTAESIPGVKRSNRSFAGFLNKAALELYADMVEAAGPDGAGATEAQKKLLADFVNVSLGYGYGKKDGGKKLSLIPAVLDAIAWAPRKAVAELKYATGWNLLSNMNTFRNEISAREIWNVDKQIMREYLRFTLGSLAFNACLLLLAKLINGDDDKDRNNWDDMRDPRSTEFGRVRIGNTTWSVFAGNEAVWRLLARLYTGQTKSNGIVKDYKYHGLEAVLSYLRGKLNPIYSTAVDVKMGENFVGEKLSEKSGFELASNYLLPLTANALYENFAKNPDDPLAAIFNAVPTFFGMTNATYERDPLKRVTAQYEEARRQAKSADDETAERIDKALEAREREDVYDAAKGVQNTQKALKNLEARAKTLKYTIDHSDDGGSQKLQEDYAELVKEIEETKKELAGAREKAMKTYRENRDRRENPIRWGSMDWAR